MKRYGTIFLALAGNVLMGNMAAAQDIGVLIQRPAIASEYKVVEAPQTEDGREITGMVQAFLAIDQNGRVTDVLWQDSGVAVLDKLAKTQPLPERRTPRQQCDQPEGPCRNVAAYQKLSFVFPAAKISKRPAIRTQPNYVYPRLALELGESGSVELGLFVDAAGNVQIASIRKHSGSGKLARGAIKMAKQIKFYPAEYQGQPVWTYVVAPIQFQLK